MDYISNLAITDTDMTNMANTTYEGCKTAEEYEQGI